MKILLNTINNKTAFVKAILKKHAKAKPNNKANLLFLTELIDPVDEINLIKTGMFKGRSAEELLMELS